jgi:hypothetical protein
LRRTAPRTTASISERICLRNDSTAGMATGLACSHVSTKSERRAARERIAAYHERCLTQLVEHAADSIDQYRKGDIDVHAVDETIYQFHRASRELEKFCWGMGSGAHVDFVASLIDDDVANGTPRDWWELGKPRRR